MFRLLLFTCSDDQKWKSLYLDQGQGAVCVRVRQVEVQQSGTTMVLEIDDQLPPFRRLTGDEDGECQKKKVKVNNKDLKKVERDEEEVDRDLEKAIRNRDNEIRDLEKTIRNQEKINRDQKMVIKKLKKKMKKLQDILSNPEDPTQTLQRCKGLLKKMTAITD